MNAFIKYFIFVPAVLLPMVSCTEETPEAVEPSILLESVSIVMDVKTAAKLYTDATTESTMLPMIVGETITLGFSTVPEDISEITFPEMKWTSSNEAAVTVDENGEVTAVAAGSAVITIAPETINLVAEASLNIIVTETAVPATSITITDDHTMVNEATGLPACYIGETMTLTAVISPSDATYKSVLWSSVNESIATVDAITGVVTGVDAGAVDIIATALDENPVTATHTIYIDQIVIPSGFRMTNVTAGENILMPYDYGTFEVQFDTWPEESTRTLIEWTTSDSGVATVSNGVVTVKGYGNVTITATCPGDESLPEGYVQSAQFSMSFPAGYYNEHFATSDRPWYLDTSHISNGAKLSWIEGVENYLEVTPYLSSGTARGDLIYNNMTLSGKYPVICLRLDDVNDRGYSRNFNIDGNGGSGLAGSYSGNLGGSNNKWKTKYKCSDDSAILVYNLLEQAFATSPGVFSATEEVSFTKITLKYADIKTPATQEDAIYRFFWFMTFESEEDMNSYLQEWSDETNITYE